MTEKDTGLPIDFIEGFRLSVYMFLNYKITQQSNTIFQVFQSYLYEMIDESRQVQSSHI